MLAKKLASNISKYEPSFILITYSHETIQTLNKTLDKEYLLWQKLRLFYITAKII